MAQLTEKTKILAESLRILTVRIEQKIIRNYETRTVEELINFLSTFDPKAEVFIPDSYEDGSYIEITTTFQLEEEEVLKEIAWAQKRIRTYEREVAKQNKLKTFTKEQKAALKKQEEKKQGLHNIASLEKNLAY